MSIKKIISTATATLLLSSALPAFASSAYIGIQYAQTEYEQSGTGSTASDGEGEPSAIFLLGGYKFSDNIAIEGRLGFDAGDDTFTFRNSATTQMEIDQVISILGKFSLGESVSPYLLVGYSDVELDTNNAGTAEGDGVSFGAGIDIKVSDNSSIGLEYIQYIDEGIANSTGDAKLTSASIGYSYHF